MKKFMRFTIKMVDLATYMLSHNFIDPKEYFVLVDKNKSQLHFFSKISKELKLVNIDR